MKKERINVSRREFLIRSTTVGTGFALGLYLPLGSREVMAAESVAAKAAEIPEVNAWVVIKPDDTVVIRIARSEMRMTTEYPTPGQNLAREKVWRSFSTGGSQGIRGSHLYVRKGGAVARHMLIEAAAEQWSVPMEECQAANSVITHAPSGRTTT